MIFQGSDSLVGGGTISVSEILERHGIVAVVDGSGGLLITYKSLCLEACVQDSLLEYPKQGIEFHYLNSIAASFSLLGLPYSTLVQSLDMAASGFFQEDLAKVPFYK